MSRKKQKRKKRACKNIVNNYYIITNSEKPDKKVSISQKLTFISAIITLIIAIINLITKIIGWGRGALSPKPYKKYIVFPAHCQGRMSFRDIIDIIGDVALIVLCISILWDLKNRRWFLWVLYWLTVRKWNSDKT